MSVKTLKQIAVENLNLEEILKILQWKVSEDCRVELEERIRRISRTIRNRDILRQLYNFYGPGLDVPDAERFFQDWIKGNHSKKYLDKALSLVDAQKNGEILIKLGANPIFAADQLEAAYLHGDFGKITDLRDLGVPITQKIIENIIKKKPYRLPDLFGVPDLDYERLLEALFVDTLFLSHTNSLFQRFYNKVNDQTVFTRLKNDWSIKKLLELEQKITPPSHLLSFIQYRLTTFPEAEVRKVRRKEEIKKMSLEEFLAQDLENSSFKELISRKAISLIVYNCYRNPRPSKEIFDRLYTLVDQKHVSLTPQSRQFSIFSKFPGFFDNWLKEKERTPEELDQAIRNFHLESSMIPRLLELGAILNLDRERELNFRFKTHNYKAARKMLKLGVEVNLETLNIFFARYFWLRKEHLDKDREQMLIIINLVKEKYLPVLFEDKIDSVLHNIRRYWFRIDSKEDMLLLAETFEILASRIPKIKVPKDLSRRDKVKIKQFITDYPKTSLFRRNLESAIR